jgi:ribonuclease-3
VSPDDDFDAQSDPVAVLERALGHEFEDRVLLEVALQHASYAHEKDGLESNDRLEFLGDAVLGLVVGHLLFEAHPDWQEGDLTRGLSQLVDRRALARLGRQLDLGSCLRLGRTEVQSEGQGKDSILADAIEAVMAALYLDGGLDAVKEFARRVFSEVLDPEAPRVIRDPKTRFQEWAMAEYAEFPSYQLTGDTGIEGHELRFSVSLSVQGEEWARATGRSKRAAERLAAERAFAQREEIRRRSAPVAPPDTAGSSLGEGGGPLGEEVGPLGEEE